MSSALWPLTKQIKLYNKCGGRKLLQQIWLQYCDSSNVFCLSRMCTDGKAVITHDSTSVSWSKAVPAVSTIHLALECDCLKVWNFMTQFPCRFFRSGIKWNCSQGDHVSRNINDSPHIKHIIHISTNTDNGGKSIVWLRFLYVLLQFVCVLEENQCLKKEKNYRL